MESPTYLGDSVYASFDGYQIKLFTNNGFGESNVIFLEDGTYDALLKFVEKFENDGKVK